MPDPRQLAIVGYGKMGKLVEQLAPQFNFAVALKLDEFNNANGEGVTAANFRASMWRSTSPSPPPWLATWRPSPRSGSTW